MIKLKLLILLILVSAVGCKTRIQRTKEFHEKFDIGEYDLATKIVQSQIDKSDEENKSLTKKDMLWALYTGIAQKSAKNYDESIKTFDKVEDLLKKFDKENSLCDAGSQTGAVILNDNFLDYEGAEYDGVMVNTYKALAFLAKGDNDNARIELNRANDRERRALEKYKADIAKLNEEKKGQKEKLDKTLETEGVKNMYSNMDSWVVYKDFVNPFTIYLTGLFRMLSNDNNTAENYFKEALAYSPNNSFVKDDFNRLIKNNISKNTAWIIFENGLGPIKEEKRIDIPIPIPNSPVYYVGMALPFLKELPTPFKYLEVNNKNQTVKTEFLSSMDSVIKTEFKKDFTGIVTRAVISLIAKTTAQVVAKKQGGELGGLAVAGFSWLTNGADTRIWSALPKEFQIAKIQIPKTRILNIKSDKNKIITVKIPKCNNAIVYIKIPTKKAKPLIDVFAF